jgi:hypothetical protein
MVSVAPAWAAAPARTAAQPDASVGYAFSGDAYGTEATVGKTVTSGRTAPVQIGCTTVAGARLHNTSAGVDVSPLLQSGTVATTARTRRTPVGDKTTAAVQGVSLLDGLITGSAVRASSATRVGSSGFTTSGKGTSFTSLVIAGSPVTGSVKPNTRIDVAGFGYVVLNEQSGHVGARDATLTVNALHLVITQGNALGIPVGASVVVSHAVSGLAGPTAATLDGFAYGSRLQAAGALSSDATFKVALPCLGTNARIKEDQGAGVSLPGVLETGVIDDTAQGSVSGSNVSGETVSTVNSASVLGSLVQATVITADAHASSDGNTTTLSDAGSSFGTLAVQGFPQIGPDVAPNTRLRIAGLGVLWLHRVITRGDSIEVRMIELVVRHDNSEGLPLGADLRVAVAEAGVH